MNTILKFPVYVSIETDNIDRAKVSKVSKEILYPQLLNYLAKAGVRSSILNTLSKELHSSVSVSLLTEIDLIHKAVSREVPSTTVVKDEFTVST